MYGHLACYSLPALHRLIAMDPTYGIHDTIECAFVARKGTLAGLQALRARQIPAPWDSSVCDAAASADVMDPTILKWITSQDPCLWDVYLCLLSDTDDVRWTDEAAVVELARLRALDPPAPWDESVCEEAAGRGWVGALAWLRSQDPPCPWDPEVCADATRTLKERDAAAVLEWMAAVGALS